MKKLILIGIISMCIQLVFAQTTGWENFVNPEIITDHVETNNEIWFSSKAGVIKLDKATLQKTYYNRVTANLPTNIVEGIAKDSNGDIWIGTYNQAIAKFDGTTWTTYDFSHLSPSTSSVISTYCIEVDNQDNVWVGTNRGLIRFDGTNWQLFNGQNTGSSFHDVWALDLDNQGNLYAASFRVYKYDGTSFHDMTDTLGLAIYGEALLFNDSNNNFWVTNTIGDIGMFDGTTWTKYSNATGDFPFGKIYTLDETPNGDVFITMEDSGKYVLQNGVWVSTNIANTIPLTDGNLTTHFYDNQGNEWLANGENVVKNDGQNITSLNLKTQELAENNIRSIEIFNNIKYFVTNQEINTFDGTTWGTLDFPDSLFGNWFFLRQVEVIDANNIWICSSNRGFLHWNGSVWTLYNQNNSNLPSLYINEFLYDENSQTLWCTGSAGLVKFDGTNWTTYNSTNTPMGDDFIRAIALDNNGVLYTSVTTSVVEVWRFDGTNWLNVAIGNTPPQFAISKIHFDNNNTLWAGSWYGGIYKYNGFSWENWNVSNSDLTNDNILSLASDNQGNIYIGTAVGAAKFDGTNWTLWTTQNSGLSYNRVHDLAVENNKIWFGTGHGISTLQLNTTNTTSIISQNESLNVYPNPITDKAVLQFTTTEQTDQIQVNIISLDGRTIQEMIIAGNRPKGEQQLEIQKGNLSSGMYYLQIRYNDKQMTKAILIK